MRRIISLTISLLLFGCVKSDECTQVFSSYLKRHYNSEIPDKQHSFVVFPRSIGCAGCNSTTFNFIMQNQYKEVSIICSPELSQTIPQTTSYEVLIDSIGEIETLNLQTQNVTILATNNGEIEDIVSLQAENLDSTLSAYFIARSSNGKVGKQN